MKLQKIIVLLQKNNNIISFMKKAYILLAEGFETIEALTPTDVLRRCGIEAKMTSISDKMDIVSSHGVVVRADIVMESHDFSDGDAIVLPGGFPGYENLGKSVLVGTITREYYEGGKIVAAICGAPTVLAKNGIAKGDKITCHRSVKGQMTDYIHTGKAITRCGNLITGIGAGRSLDFAFAIAAALADEETIAKVKLGMELDANVQNFMTYPAN